MAKVWQEKLRPALLPLRLPRRAVPVLNTDDPPGVERRHRQGAGRRTPRRRWQDNTDVRWTIVVLHKPLWTAANVEKNGWLRRREGARRPAVHGLLRPRPPLPEVRPPGPELLPAGDDRRRQQAARRRARRVRPHRLGDDEEGRPGAGQPPARRHPAEDLQKPRPTSRQGLTASRCIRARPGLFRRRARSPAPGHRSRPREASRPRASPRRRLVHAEHLQRQRRRGGRRIHGHGGLAPKTPKATRGPTSCRRDTPPADLRPGPSSARGRTSSSLELTK